MRHSLRRSGLAASLAVLLAGAVAQAQTNVPTISCPTTNVVFVSGSSAVRSLLTVVAPLLAAESPPYSIVYQSQGSCVGVSSVFSADPNARLMKDIPAAGGKAANYAILFASDGSTKECSLPTGGVTVDVGVSDVFASTCGATAPTGVAISDYEGPIQVMTFVVPAVSSQRSISAEAAYMVFGMGSNNGVATPWTNQTLYFVRNASSGTQQMVARAIGVPGDKWWGTDRGSADGVRKNMKLILDAENAEKSIGILSTDITDEERSNLRVLAFQAKGQTCGFLPDSTSFAEDKKNVRDGHYPIWGPVHFFTRTENGLPTPAAGALVSRFASARLDQELVQAIIAKHLVPKCAMKVKRTTEMGPLSAYKTESACGCFFDKVANGATSCKTCGGPGDCPASAPACNYGYCESL